MMLCTGQCHLDNRAEQLMLCAIEVYPNMNSTANERLYKIHIKYFFCSSSIQSAVVSFS